MATMFFLLLLYQLQKTLLILASTACLFLFIKVNFNNQSTRVLYSAVACTSLHILNFTLQSTLKQIFKNFEVFCAMQLLFSLAKYINIYCYLKISFDISPLFLQMEFSFGSKKWLPRESLMDRQDGSDNYALGLHAPGFFDRVLNVDKCLLQSEPANMVYFLCSFTF